MHANRQSSAGIESDSPQGRPNLLPRPRPPKCTGSNRPRADPAPTTPLKAHHRTGRRPRQIEGSLSSGRPQLDWR
ncbi:hypothetical protein DDJ39_07605 [Mycobacteroides abscessus]|nr:hypothetical protein DDJ39_07605 [Mycobacteroides abscessus]